jgi:hypothetical protein
MTHGEGEPDLRVRMNHHSGRTVSERITSGLTFSSGLELLRNRTEGSAWGVVRFDRAMMDYQLASGFGMMLPDAMQESAIARMRIVGLGESTPEAKKSFDAPSNVMFIPVEYWAVNCCPPCPGSNCEYCDQFLDPNCPCEPTGGGECSAYNIRGPNEITLTAQQCQQGDAKSTEYDIDTIGNPTLLPDQSTATPHGSNPFVEVGLFQVLPAEKKAIVSVTAHADPQPQTQDATVTISIAFRCPGRPQGSPPDYFERTVQVRCGS